MELSKSEFDSLRSWTHRLCGLAIPNTKAYLIQHRLEPIARAAGCRDFSAFIALLQGSDGRKWCDEIIEAITTNETSFFRDVHPFDTFRRRVLPELTKESIRRKSSGGLGTIRVWSAGVATGQEVYSLAMAIEEETSSGRLPGLKPGDVSILATDVSSRVLVKAATGRFTDRETLRGLTAEQIRRFFIRQGTDSVILPSLRQRVEFRKLNLIEPFAHIGSFDLILCRNVLIYFDDSTRLQICKQFATMLSPNGVLLLGAMESLIGLDLPLVADHTDETLLYRKTQTKALLAPIPDSPTG